MMHAKFTLPLRFRILEYASHRESFTIDDLLRDLRDEYVAERQFTLRILSQHCDSMLASGMIEQQNVDVSPEGALVFRYRLTDYGRERLVYLPDAWKGGRA